MAEIEQFYPSEIVDIDSIEPWATNYKVHPDRQIQVLGESIGDYGQAKNICVWHDKIVAGHGLWASAKHKGWGRIEVKRLPDEWDEAKVEAFLVADNRIAELAGTDEVLLAGMLTRIQSHEKGKKLIESTGYNDGEISTKMAMIRQHAMLNTMNNESGLGSMAGKTTLASANGLGISEGGGEPDGPDSAETAVLMGETSTITYADTVENPTAAYVQLQFPMLADDRNKVVATLNKVKMEFGLATSIQALVKLCEQYGGE